MNQKKFLTLLTLMLFMPSAFADLQVFPLRAMLSDKQRSTQLSLRHQGTKPMRYKISVVYYKMNPDGSVVQVDPPEAQDKSASKLFRYSPKEVTLEPNVEQVVRIMTRPMSKLAEGDYRAHLYFVALDDPAEDKPGPTTAGKATMSLKGKIAIAIPIIVRKGSPKLEVKLSDFKVEKDPSGKALFSVNMSQEGNAFAYGDFELNLKPKSGSERIVGEVKGVSSYIPKRNVRFPITDKLAAGELTLTFKDPATEIPTVLSTVKTEVPAGF